MHRTIYMCYMYVQVVMHLQQSNSAVLADFLTLSEYHVNKHLTEVQVQVTGNSWCESTKAQFILLGTHYSVFIVTLTVV